MPQMLKDGKSMAIYHTAGKGTRLAPLPGAENNNKPGVKLPALLKCDGELTLLTILESVLRQTSSYAAVRPARVSVFWGDQARARPPAHPPLRRGRPRTAARPRGLS